MCCSYAAMPSPIWPASRGSMNFAAEPSVNSPEMIKRLAETMAEAEIKPELATSAWTRSALGLWAYAGASHTVDGK